MSTFESVDHCLRGSLVKKIREVFNELKRFYVALRRRPPFVDGLSSEGVLIRPLLRVVIGALHVPRDFDRRPIASSQLVGG